MTQVEIEAELNSLRAQLAQLHEQQDMRTKAWLSIGVLCWCFALLFFVTSAIVFFAWGMVPRLQCNSTGRHNFSPDISCDVAQQRSLERRSEIGMTEDSQIEAPEVIVLKKDGSATLPR